MSLPAFRAVDFDWTRRLQSVWQDPPFNVEALHKDVADDIFGDFLRLQRPGSTAQLGRVVVGPAGSGKTHLIGTLRKRVWDAGGWFVLLDIVGITDFWRTAALGFINSLHQLMPNGRPQYDAVLIGVLKSLPPAAVRAVVQEEGGFERGNTVQMADRFVGLLNRAHPTEAMRHRDVVRAFILLRDEDAINSAYSWLQGWDIGETERERLHFGPPPKAVDLVRGMSWFMGLAGPILIAADQLDAIVTAANLTAGSSPDTSDDAELKARAIIQTLAGGLMDLYDVTSRSMTVVTCLPETWHVLRSRALAAAQHRFVEPRALEVVRDVEIARHLISERLEAAYREQAFAPPYPTWPFLESAVESAAKMHPRTILMRCDAHRRRSITQGAVAECASLLEPAEGGAPPAPPDDLDQVFARHRESANVSDLREAVDEALRDLIAEALALYVKQTQTPENVDLVLKRDPDEQKPTLHGRLVFTFHAEGDREQHYCFRVIGQSNPIAFQARLRAAMTASGIDAKLAFRHLIIVRGDELPSGRVTQELVEAFKEFGGKLIAPCDEDLRVMRALREMMHSNLEGFDAWLWQRQPLCGTALFKEAGLCPPPLPVASGQGQVVNAELTKGASPGTVGTETGISAVNQQTESPARKNGSLVTGGEEEQAPERPAAPARDIPIGRRIEGGGEGRVEHLRADLLPRHTAILAGSGSGKTVLLRRIVEEAALLGIPAIVLDSNNDLARLGDPWPEEPPDFDEEDKSKARAYAESVEVVVWTPGISAGNPLFLSLLPDFSGLQEEGERNQAVGMARSTLLPFVGGSGASAALREGVLSQALQAFSVSGRGGLDALIAFLSDLPEGVTEIRKGKKIAADIADQLRAAIAANPLLKARGRSLDPQVLFHAASEKTRISVINLSGLPEETGRQAFVNQLQMALFTWIKRHPSPTGRLYVMDEAQNFAPSGRSTPSRESTLALAAQARKYGLGMIFATQAPKGIETNIVSNCTTHFYGRLSSPATIQAAKELMAAKGGGGDDIGRLSAGQFYFVTEGLAKPVKVRTPLCLSHHPPNPLDPGEVEERAKRAPAQTAREKVSA